MLFVLIKMGQSFSIDKHVSSLDDLLDMSAYYFSKVKFESRISSDITQHLKVSPVNQSVDVAVLRRQIKVRLCQTDASRLGVIEVD